MFYVKGISGKKYGVIDTDDNVVDLFTKKELLDIESKGIASIDGVDLQAGAVFIVSPAKETIKLIKARDYGNALDTLTTRETIGIKFKTKPTTGDIVMVHHEVLNISRDGIDSFSFDRGSSKSYRSGLSETAMYKVLRDFNGWLIDNVKIGAW